MVPFVNIFQHSSKIWIAMLQLFINDNYLNNKFTPVALNGGSNGFKWTALRLPSLQLAGSGAPYATSTGERNYLDTPLLIGDTITGQYSYSDYRDPDIIIDNIKYLKVDNPPLQNFNLICINGQMKMSILF